MVRRCSDQLAKLLMIIFNGIFLVCGIAIFAIGVSNISFDGQIKAIVTGLSGVNVTVIVVGAVISIISFMGFCGACRESSCLITSFMVCMVLILLLEIIVAGMALANRDQLKNVIEDGLRDTVKQRESKPILNSAWSDLEISLKCCGARSFRDYSGAIPTSCCSHKVDSCYEFSKSFNRRSCIVALEEFLKAQYLVFGIIFIVIAFVEIIGIIFSCCLRSAINERYQTV